MQIRPEKSADRVGIRAVNEAAFGTTTEADLVDTLRANTSRLISLVAVVDDAIVGHVLFSPVSLIGHAQLDVMGLGPIAIAPEQQRKGVGSALVREGLRQCRDRGCRAVVVLGHPDYYPRFGFVPASRYGIRCEYDVPADAFMITELETGALHGRSGTIRYDDAFAGA